jgi:protein-S-isoprenylcysteine O-methyltransferase Ste14
LSLWRQVRAIGPLPGMGAVVVPALIVATTDEAGFSWLGAVAGLPLVAAGLALMWRTIALFSRMGEGTLAPWDPTRKMVIAGPYRYVRNPMITGVTLVLLGEAAILGSLGILAWAGVFAAVNAVWMPLVEEPGLERRFGEEYDEYGRNVPRWVPRRTPWSPR